jgi:hypothetical protein
MTKIVVGSPSLTHHLLLYPGLGPAMLDNIGGVGLYIGYMREILDYNIIIITLTIISLTPPALHKMQRECNGVAFEEFIKHAQLK